MKEYTIEMTGYDGWFYFTCPELDVAGAAATPLRALENVISCMLWWIEKAEQD